jgi:hypothetical protein
MRLSSFGTLWGRLVSVHSIHESETKALDFDPAVQWDECRAIWVVNGLRCAPIIFVTIATITITITTTSISIAWRGVEWQFWLLSRMHGKRRGGAA